MKKNLIFDVGDVLIGYRWKEMLTEDFGLSEEMAEEMGRRVYEDPMWDDFDRGLVEIDGLVEHYCDLYPEDADLIRKLFYNNDLMTVKRERVWDRVRQLKMKGYRIYILSNYSEYLFKYHTDGLPFHKYLDGGVVSYEVHLIKPEPEIYRHLLEKYDIDPGESVFFDDRPENIAGAKKAGIEGVLVTSEKDLLSELEKF